MEIFKLSDNFLSKYEKLQPKWGFGSLSYFVYKRTYSRLQDNGKKEEFFHTIKRCIEGTFNIQLQHCRKMHLPWDAFRAQISAQKMFQKMWEFKFLPPGRGLWTMGTPVVDKIGSAALNNCGFISTKDIHKSFSDPFTWACDMLMLGVGVGYDTLGAGKITIYKPWIGTPGCKTTLPIVHEIPDTREGWVESIHILLDSYTDEKSGHYVVFDYSKIRPAGAPIAGFGGTASGPEPLMEGHENLRKLLDSYHNKILGSVGITDIMNYIGKFVVAGNVRRSAEIAIGEIDDTDFIQMKDFNLYPKELKDRRWMSNNSVFASTSSDFSSVCKNIAVNGEPGLIFMETARSFGRIKDGPREFGHYKFDDCDGFNPCAEQSLKSYELCNLVETFPANHDSAEEYYDTLKYAYLFAKSVTLVPTHCEKTNEIMLQNRRIGCSQSGIQQAIKKFGIQPYLSDFCDKGYKVINNWDHIYSRWLGIPTSIKMTTVKPSGTVSILAGSTPGVHCTHSEYYFRTIRVASSSPYTDKLKKAGYRVEESVTDKKTSVVYFAVKESNFTKSKYDISLWEQMTLVKELQHYWSDNSVSCTITFKSEEAKDLKSAIEYFAPYVKTLSFLPLENHNYPQAPYQAITKDEYTDYHKKIKKLNLKNESEKAVGEKYCSNDTCTI
jgi:ribonucleoside-triphosphate reductase